ncbi:hypothetical protein GCM10022221_36270 [Actinocorallia aurea]
MTPRSQLTITRETPPPEIAEILGIPEGEEVVVRHRLMFADETPVQLAPSYLPLDIAAGTILEEPDQGRGGMLSRLADLGHAQTRITERVTVRPPTSQTTPPRHFLRDVGSPSISAKRTADRWTRPRCAALRRRPER